MLANTKTQTTQDPPQQVKDRHSIEFFHVYTDEKINEYHMASINYLSAAEEVWDFARDSIILIDNYNPTQHVLTADEIFAFLAAKSMTPRYWAFEADFVQNAQQMLAKVSDKKLIKSYESYITKHNKYPCSLLTASWYMTRLGQLDSSMIKTTMQGDSFNSATRLINILPEAYKEVEERALGIIARSSFSEYQDKIQDLFYTATAHRKVDLF